MALRATDLLTTSDISQQDIRGNAGGKTPFITARRELWEARGTMGDMPPRTCSTRQQCNKMHQKYAAVLLCIDI